MSYKVICTDIDGTLLDHRRELSELTIKTFKELPPKTEVILASSRMPSAMTHLQQQLGRLNSPLICYNGGYVIHYKDRNPVPDVLYSTVIQADVCEGIIALTRNTSIHSSLYFEDTWYAPQIDYWSEREARITKVAPVITRHSEVIASWKEREIGAHKVMCMGEENEINALEHKLSEMFSDDIHIYRSRPTYLELAPRIISKGSALQLLLEKSLSAELTDVMAFGDNYNDIELLKLAGKGIAVSNARKEVIDVADEVTLDSKADGVALAIQKYRGDFYSG